MWIYKHNSETFKSIIPSFPLFPRNNNGIETEEIERKELIERLNYYNCGQIRAEHFRERHRDSRSFLKRPFLSLSLPSREFSEADIIGFVTVLSANRPILRCILLGINLPFCFWVTAFGRFSGETGVLIANTKPRRRTWIDTSSSGPGLDRPLREDIPRNDWNGEMVSLLGELSTFGRNRKWVFFSPLPSPPPSTCRSRNKDRSGARSSSSRQVTRSR